MPRCLRFGSRSWSSGCSPWSIAAHPRASVTTPSCCSPHAWACAWATGNFLPKPFSDDEILAAVAEALERGARLDSARKANAELRAHYQALTPREREVFALVAAGLLNKIVADRLQIAEKTVKVHRHQVMEKMGAASIADLVRMAEHLALPCVPPSERS